VSKPTIYRRWKGKADLATAAIRTLQIAEPPVATGSARGDLVGILRNFQRSLLRPNGPSLIGTVLAEESHTPELLRLFRKRIVTPRRHMLRQVLERAAALGELRRGVDPDTAAALLIGGFYAHYLANPRIPPRFPEEAVSLLWDGIARR
jgi:AcrR family transcriptional regulator